MIPYSAGDNHLVSSLDALGPVVDIRWYNTDTAGIYKHPVSTAFFDYFGVSGHQLYSSFTSRPGHRFRQGSQFIQRKPSSIIKAVDK